MKEYKIDWQDQAINDIKDIRAYLETNPNISIETTERILSNLFDQGNSLTVFPARFQIISGSPDKRHLLVEGYSIFYRIVEERHLVQILYVYHQARDIGHIT
jgi:addiction module RelE/StbE family toxin